jgi:hypothetical protein
MHTKLKISNKHLNQINDLILDSNSQTTKELLKIIKKYGSIEEINQKAKEARKIPNILKRLEKINPSYVKDLNWLMEQRDQNAFVSIQDYQQKVLGKKNKFRKKGQAVTLEISALQYFPWLIEEAKKAIANKELMPGRFIRVRKMAEQEKDGDLLATVAAMQIMGASCVETLDTRGTDGSNIHLIKGGETIFGWLGGVGQPNKHALDWINEFLYYYTKYGVQEVLNINPGTVVLGYMLYKMGIDINFKISVFMGNDNPYSVFWTLMTAKLFSRKDGTTPLVGFNLSNAADNYTLKRAAAVRDTLEFNNPIRLEHHVTEPDDIVAQPYDRRDEVVELAKTVTDISAKHEAGLPKVEEKRKHRSKIGDYFRDKQEVIKNKDMSALTSNYLDKHEALNSTAKKLVKKGVPFVAAGLLHK